MCHSELFFVLIALPKKVLGVALCMCLNVVGKRLKKVEASEPLNLVNRDDIVIILVGIDSVLKPKAYGLSINNLARSTALDT